MTYARARLWIGISGVGMIVVISALMLAGGIPQLLLPNAEHWQRADLIGLSLFVVALIVVVLPFDMLGGYVLPKRFGREVPGFQCFLRRWLVGVTTQSVLFFATGLAILAAGRLMGLVGVLAVISLVAIAYVISQGVLTRILTKGVWHGATFQLEPALQKLSTWEQNTMPISIVDHDDSGFTGGVVGLPGRETILVPRKWLVTLSSDELAAAIARRTEAVKSGSRTRGFILALFWVLVGFALAALLPGAGVRSVAQLVTTCCGFTCWTFLGLLILPTVSRRASCWVDQQVLRNGIPQATLTDTFAALDRLQDDEPNRPVFVEAIFHPVPSVDNRKNKIAVTSAGAWHVARMMLFLSWSCLGLLSRVVHCNAGRPELWAMLPSD